jgi:hypothetical protein
MSAIRSSLWAGLCLAAGLGCSQEASVDVGGRGPVLLKMYWSGRQVGDGRAVVWSADNDPALKTGVTPAPFEFELVFDKRLDGDEIEDTVVQGGVVYTVPKQMPLVTVTWDAMPDNLRPLTVAYNSLTLAGAPAQSTYVFGRADHGYPSSTALTFHLDQSKLTGTDGRPMIGPETIAVTTGPFTLHIPRPAVGDAGAAPVVPGDFRFALAFSNQPGAPDDIIPFVTFLVDGSTAPFRLVPTDQDPTTLYVAPPQLGQTWPAGALITVSVRAGLPDIFGVPLGDGADAEFLIVGTHAPVDDGGVDSSD